MWAVVFGSVIALAAAGTPTVGAPSIPQAWQSTGVDYQNTDSLAAIRVGDAVHVFATAKDGDVLHVFDGAAGRFIKNIGRTGAAPGEFRYPNGVAAAEHPVKLDSLAEADAKGGSRRVRADASMTRPLIFVVERDNNRVQALWADTHQPAGIFGDDVLNRPYGVATSWRDGVLHLYVTDTEVAPEKTVRVFRIALRGDRVHGELIHTFGAKDGPGVIAEAESIVVDDARDRVFLCDEDSRDVKAYTRDGVFTGDVIAAGYIRGDAEGIVILPADASADTQAGCIIVTDQQDLMTTWHVFDRQTYQHVAYFTGEPLIARTDGICLFDARVGDFNAGLLYAVHNDAAVRAYPLDQIRRLIDQHRRHMAGE